MKARKGVCALQEHITEPNKIQRERYAIQVTNFVDVPNDIREECWGMM
jgi:hypothetical protein